MLDSHTDADQVKAYRDGDNRAFDQLYGRYEKPLYSFILRTMCDRSMADDLFQQTWLKAIKGLPSYDEQGKFSSWIFGIAHNVCIDQIRTKQKKIEANTIQTDTEKLSQMKENSPDPEAIFLRNEEKALIEQSLQQIPEEQQQVLLLRLNGEMPFKEIAEMMHCSINTVLGRMYYAVKNVRKIVQESTGEGRSMSCPEFDKQGLRYLLHELDPKESETYRHHMIGCPFCKNELTELSETLEDLKSDSMIFPSEVVRNRILSFAHTKRIRQPIMQMIHAYLQKRKSKTRPKWQTAFVAGLAFVIFLIVRPMLMQPSLSEDSDILAWEDDFITEALSIDAEIQTIQSGESQGQSLQSFINGIDEVNWTSPSSEDFESIRDRVDVLAESLTGI